jgi:hypothetical protein
MGISVGMYDVSRIDSGNVGHLFPTDIFELAEWVGLATSPISVTR